MNEESYNFEKGPEIYYYEFYSDGPNGKIKQPPLLPERERVGYKIGAVKIRVMIKLNQNPK